jgi:multiple sugar transport system permease protein
MDRERRVLSLRAGLALLAPVLALVGLFLVIPAFWVLTISFTNEQLIGPTAINWSFIGLENFRHLFDASIWLQPGQFGWSLRQTLIFVALCVAGQMSLGLALAWYFHRRRGWYRELFFAVVIVAWVVPDVVVAVTWFAFLDKNAGTLNAIIGIAHLPRVSWLLQHPMVSIVMFNIWRGTAFSLLMFAGAFSSLPGSYLEAASVLGASGWQAFRQVVLPLVRTHALTGLLLTTLSTFNTFTPFLLTGGGPSYASEVVPIYVWRTAFQNYDLGQGAAVAVVMLLFNLVVSLIYLAALRRQRR